MIKSGFSYVKLIAVVAILAISLISSLRPSAATTGPMMAPDVDLRSEQQSITRYADDLIVYENQAAELGKRAALVNTEVEPLQRKSDDLKGRLSGVQNAVREIVRKLKAADEWDDIDARAAARIRDPRHRAFFQDSSFKQLLQDSENIGSQANEISSPLDALRRKVTSRNYGGAEVQMVRAAFTEPVPFESGSIGCRIGRLGLKIVIGLGGTPSREQSDRVFNRCHPDGTINPF